MDESACPLYGILFLPLIITRLVLVPRIITPLVPVLAGSDAIKRRLAPEEPATLRLGDLGLGLDTGLGLGSGLGSRSGSRPELGLGLGSGSGLGLGLGSGLGLE